MKLKFKHYLQQELSETEGDLSELPDGEISKIKTNIRKGAQDLDQKWASALELVHTAYEVAQVQRPWYNSKMKKAWEQYEEMISYACQELAKARGRDGDWRSSSVFTEAETTDEEQEYNVEASVDGLPVNVIRRAKSIDDLIKNFYTHNITGCDIELRHRGVNNVCLYFVKDGKRTGEKVTIRKRK